MAAKVRFPGTALVACHPLASGHGMMAAELRALGLLDRLVMFKIRPGDSGVGFDRVVGSRFNPAGAAVLASFYLNSPWRREAQGYRWTHLSSPHFFHLARTIPTLSGVVHDLGHLDPPSVNRSPVGYRFLMNRELRWARRLKGLVTISDTTRERLMGIDRDLAAVTIHNWTGDEFRYRDRQEARASLGLPADRHLILSVGLDIPRKNTDLLPRLARELGPRFAVVRIGESRRIAPSFPPGALIAVPEVPLDRYPLYFNAADLLVYPSLDEGFGRPLIEAVNSGTPLLASDIPIFREVLRGGEHLVPVHDLARWAEGCRRAVEIDDRRRSGGLYPELADHYRAPRALAEYSAFFAGLGLA